MPASSVKKGDESINENDKSQTPFQRREGNYNRISHEW